MFIKATDIPVTAKALYFVDHKDKTQEIVFTTSVRTAKMQYKRMPAREDYTEIGEYGFMIIGEDERQHGMMVW